MIFNKDLYENKKRELFFEESYESSYEENNNDLKEETFYFNVSDYSKETLKVINQSIDLIKTLETNLTLRFIIEKNNDKHIFKINYYNDIEKNKLYKIIDLYKKNITFKDSKVFKTISI